MDEPSSSRQDENQDAPAGNPYRPTELSARAAPVAIDGVEFPAGMTRGMVGHVRVFGILMIVHGVIDILASLGAAGYAWVLPTAISSSGSNSGAAPVPPEFSLVMTLVIGGAGAICLFIGVASIMAGIWAIQFRRRAGIITVLCLGLSMMLTCYCLPSSLALFVYGMIVLLNPSTLFAFQLQQRGHAAKDIEQLFLVLSRHA